ncbi:MAG: hypothetical protein [Cressdnaviricota sp.]|nr:MAG: hypothetical protein [Cressdnaviricota sp.]
MPRTNNRACDYAEDDEGSLDIDDLIELMDDPELPMDEALAFGRISTSAPTSSRHYAPGSQRHQPKPFFNVYGIPLHDACRSNHRNLYGPHPCQHCGLEGKLCKCPEKRSNLAQTPLLPSEASSSSIPSLIADSATPVEWEEVATVYRNKTTGAVMVDADMNNFDAILALADWLDQNMAAAVAPKPPQKPYNGKGKQARYK